MNSELTVGSWFSEIGNAVPPMIYYKFLKEMI